MFSSSNFVCFTFTAAQKYIVKYIVTNVKVLKKHLYILALACKEEARLFLKFESFLDY